MEPNLHFWIRENQTFVQRFLHCLDILDPINALLSHKTIKTARELLKSEQAPKDHTEDQKIQKAWKQSLATVNPDTERVIPMLFRPAAFLPITGPLVFLFLQKSKGIKAAFFPQFFIHAYNTEFSIINGNAIHAKYSLEQQLLGMTTIISTTIFGISPLFMMNRYTLKGPAVQNIVTKILPIPLLAFLSIFNVVVSRSHEYQNGIRVMDENGNVVGLSREAGTKAVGETALSRGLLFGTSVLLSSVFAYVLERIKLAHQNPKFLVAMKLNMTLLVMGLMVPVSFCVFPQTGQIPRTSLEPEIQSLTEEATLYYNRGL
ncbi:sideroflexin-4 [Antechinus flavipes]|uniref:sideroflexin-4 n=1 Tax=Antechinus flavipes TaxID=38775 RepID=UPI0022357D12|nr:sideroflexin-4 [Antechinus flavipes]